MLGTHEGTWWKFLDHFFSDSLEYRGIRKPWGQRSQPGVLCFWCFQREQETSWCNVGAREARETCHKTRLSGGETRQIAQMSTVLGNHGFAGFPSGRMGRSSSRIRTSM